MDKVWVLQTGMDYEGWNVEAIYSSRKIAVKAMNRMVEIEKEEIEEAKKTTYKFSDSYHAYLEADWIKIKGGYQWNSKYWVVVGMQVFDTARIKEDKI